MAGGGRRVVRFDRRMARSWRPRLLRGFRWLALSLGLGHLVFAYLTRGVRPEHLVADGLLIALAWLGGRLRDFAWGALPLWLTGAVTDNQRFLFPLRGSIHLDVSTRGLGLHAPDGRTWPEWFLHNTTPVLDLFAGFAYSTHILEILAVGVFLFLVQRRRFHALAWAFFLANAIGIVICMIYPAAPPWYVIAHGTGPADPTATSSAAGAARFDALLGIDYFRAFYSRNPNVFGAMPSLHSAYPVLAAWATWDRGWRWRLPTLAFACLMWFSAVYLAHHYFLDILAGIAVACFACLVAFRWLPRLRPAPPITA
jgi:inositol phosphorylceramide synthase catalytic subunit